MARKRTFDPDSPDLPAEVDPFEPAEPPEPADPGEPPPAATAPSAPPNPPPGSLATGSVLELGGAGSYEIIRPLAAGGMAEVFLARRRGAAGFERTVAIKRIHADLAGREKIERMFLEEARVVAQLHHQNIAQVFDLQKQGNALLLVMEYVAGTTIRDDLEVAHAKGLAFSPGFACYVTAEVADALHYAHLATDPEGKPLGIVHRDVSPKNIILSDHGAVKLIDFGVAKSKLADRDKTDTGLIKGTWNYLSPEQAAGADDLDGRSDVFALGLVFAELILGRRVFQGRDTEILLKVSQADPDSVAAATAGLPAALQPVLRKALAKKRDERYATAGAFGADLRAYLQAAGLSFSATQASVELAALRAAPDADHSTRLGARAAPPAAVAPAPVPPPAPAPASPAPIAAPPALAIASPAPPPPAAPPPRPAAASGTQIKRLDELRDRIRNPQNPRRRLLVPALVILGVIGIGNALFFLVFNQGTSAPPPAPEIVKTEAQLRAEREADQAKYRPPPAPAELAAPPPQAPPAAVLGLPQTSAEPPAAAPASAPAPALTAAVAPRPVRHTPPPTVAPAPPAPPPAPVRRRSLDSSTATTFADAAPAGAAAPSDVAVPRGTLVPARLIVPADPRPGPVSAEVTRDVAIGTAVAIPKGAQLVCSSQGFSAGRITLTCDTITIGDRQVRMNGTALGADRRPGLAAATIGGAGAEEHARSGAIDTAANVAGRLLGDGVTGELGRGAVRAGSSTARDATAPSATTAQPVPAGTTFFVFINSYGGAF